VSRWMLALLIAAVGCGSGTARWQSASLELVMPATPIEIAGGHTREIQILVIGAPAEEVTLSAELPSFATLVGSLLTLAPQRADAGNYQLTITATAGAQSTSSELYVTVSAPNSPPSWSSRDVMLGSGDDGVFSNPPGPGGTLPPMICPSHNCVLANPISVFVARICDADGDSVTVDVEVILLGAGFTKTPTHTVSGQVGRPQTAYCQDGDPNCSCFQLPLGDLAPDTSYEFAVRIMDEHGALASFRQAYDGTMPGDGWVHLPEWQVKTPR
jgi:hypothetical protein